MSGVLAHSVRSWLFAEIGSNPSFSNWDTLYAWSPAVQSKRMIFTAGGSGEIPPAAMRSGRNYRDEQTTVQVIFHCVGKDAGTADAEAVAAGEVFEEWLSDNPTPSASVPGLNWIRLDSYRLEGGHTDGGYAASLQYTLRYQARNT